MASKAKRVDERIPPEVSRAISERIRRWRTSLPGKRSQQDVATMIGTTQTNLSQQELGLRNLQVDALQAFQKAGVNLNWLIAGVGQMNAHSDPQAHLEIAIRDAVDALVPVVASAGGRVPAGHLAQVTVDVVRCLLAFYASPPTDRIETMRNHDACLEPIRKVIANNT